VQRESFEPQANEIPNTAPSWLPGDDYYTNFHVDDLFIKVDQGFARLPGAGYEALHPEIAGLDPERYPDITKLAILADVAPYSREYNTYRQKVGAQTKDNTELRIEYEKILDRVRQTRESVIKMDDRRFTAPVEEISGTVDEASPGGITLKEYPGRRFQFSSVGLTAADMSARILGENNQMTRCLHPAQHKSPRAHTPAGGPSTHAAPHLPLRTHRPHHAPHVIPAGLAAATLSPIRGAQHVFFRIQCFIVCRAYQ